MTRTTRPTVGSLFSGIGGFELGFEAAGFAVKWQVEIDEACTSVLRSRWPDVAKHRDVRDVGKHNLEPVDIITFGSPCQDLSVAGHRAGIGGARSGLFFEAIRVIRELRPAFAIWENVPGVFSSYSSGMDEDQDAHEEDDRWTITENSDFHAVLRAFQELGAMDIAWRTADARHFGVPQRRRRVFVVADFRAERAGEVLLESHGLPWHFAPSSDTRESITTALTGGLGTGGPDAANAFAGSLIPIQDVRDTRTRKKKPDGGIGEPSDPMYTLDTHGAHGLAISKPFVFETRIARNGRGAPDDICPPLKAESGQTGRGDAAPVIALAFDTTQITSARNYSNPKPGDPCHPLAAEAHPPAIAYGISHERGPSVTEETMPTLRSKSTGGGRMEAVAFSCKNHGNDIVQDGTPCLRAMGHDQSHSNGGGQLAVAFQERGRDGERCLESQDDLAYALTTPDGGGRSSHRNIAAGTIVRRLTPRECERLQGLGDDHTRYGITASGKQVELADAPRYRMCGNAVNAAVSEWIARRFWTVIASSR